MPGFNDEWMYAIVRSSTAYESFLEFMEESEMTCLRTFKKSDGLEEKKRGKLEFIDEIRNLVRGVFSTEHRRNGNRELVES